MIKKFTVLFLVNLVCTMDAVHKLQSAVKTQASDMRDELQALAVWERDMIKRNSRTSRVEESYCPIRGSTELGRNGEKGAGERAKEDGNEHFRNGKFEEAIRAYSAGIDKDRYGAVAHLLFSNRAMCWLKLEEWDKAEEDATSSIDLVRTYYKAYYRRALARRKKGSLKEARCDLETVLAFAPSDKDTINELKDITSALRQDEVKKAAINAPKRKKLVIEEVDDDVETDVVQQAPFASSDDEVRESQIGAKADVPKVEKETVPANVKRNPRVEELPDEPDTKFPLESKSKARPERSSNSHQASLPRKLNLREPSTFSELERTFQDIKGDVETVTKYIQVIPVEKFPSLVGVSLTPELLCGVVQATLNLEATQAHKWMESIASVRRVDELLMLLSDTEEGLLKEGVIHARTSGQDMSKIEEVLS